MHKSPNTADGVFAEALNLPPGNSRDRWLAERCGTDTVLHCEVASLLRAHDKAGDFLQPPPPQPTVRLGFTTSATPATAAMNAAAHADCFLRELRLPDAHRARKPDS